MTNGRITRDMTETVVWWVNGHTFRGIPKLIAGFFRGRRQQRRYQNELDYGPRDHEVR
jgi:hypothetical protein